MMNLRNIFYRKYNDVGYLINQNSGKSYFFDESAAIILDEVMNGNCDESQIAGSLSNYYEIDEDDELIADVHSFLEQLKTNVLAEDAVTDDSAKLPEDYVQEYTFTNKILTSVMLELTYRCNEKCFHCYTCDEIKDEDAELSTEDYYHIIDELAAFGVKELILSGGEIGVRNDFEQIYKYAIKRGFLVTLMTNGTLFSQNYFEMLLEFRPKVVYISLYGASSNTHDSVTQIPGSFEKSLCTIMKLKCAGINVCIKTVAMTCTINDYANIVKLAERLHVGLGTGMFITCGNNGCKTPAQYRLKNDEDYQRVIDTKQAYKKAYTPYRERDVNGSICEAGVTSCTIDPYGNYHVCTSLPISCGNIKEMPISEFWNKNKYLNYIRSLRFTDTGCTECEWKNECVYCIGANYVECGDLFCIQPEHCQAAHAFHTYFDRSKISLLGGGESDEKEGIQKASYPC